MAEAADIARVYRYRSKQDTRFYTLLVVGVAAALATGWTLDLSALTYRAAATGTDAPTVTPLSSASPPRFGSCRSGGGTNCVVDGDTFWMDGEKIRIADIDAPETHLPRCAEEDRLGTAATDRLRNLLNAGPIELAAIDRDTDRYGRKLRIVMRGGRSLGGMLIDEGLARRWEGQRRPWCDVSA